MYVGCTTYVSATLWCLANDTVNIHDTEHIAYLKVLAHLLSRVFYNKSCIIDDSRPFKLGQVSIKTKKTFKVNSPRTRNL